MLTWTDEKFADAVKYRELGLSAREIADKLGEGLTRNSVLGKFHRHGLSTTGQSSEMLRAKLQRRRQRVRAAAQAAKLAPAPVVVAEPAPAPVVAKAVEPHALDIPRVLSLLELESGQCKWPIGTDTLEGFCGCPAVDGKPYCPGHHARAFTTPKASIPSARVNFQLRVSTVGNSTRWGS